MTAPKLDARLPRWPIVTVGLSLAIMLGCAIWVTVLSDSFQYGSDQMSRPLPLLGILAGVAFVAHLVALWAGLRLPRCVRWTTLWFVAALVLRGVLWFSHPIQEVDLYRYLWDGAVVTQGISPYRYSPDSVLSLPATNSEAEPIKRLLDRPGLAQVHARVHFPELTTVYPPVSQAVFAITAWCVPSDADVLTHVRAMKAVILLFDIAVLWFLTHWLVRAGLHPAWSIAYGWCPLVLKEYANSGHLDSIAVFFVVVGLAMLSPRQWIGGDAVPIVSRPRLIGSAVAVGFGVGAKLFPIVLFPLICVLVTRRNGIRGVVIWSAVALLTTTITLFPMTFSQPASIETEDATDAPLPASGLKVFLSRWEMNDLLFMVVQENLRPEGSIPGQPSLWFAVTSDDWRTRFVDGVARTLSIQRDRVPFAFTRAATTLGFLAWVSWLGYRVWREPNEFAQASFLTLAWFWLLSPTQNPWYWTWALPLIPFARNRTWLLVSGCALVYYARFWFEYHHPQMQWMGSNYEGVAAFDFLVVWIEFAPILLLLAIGPIVSRLTADGVR